MTELEQRLLTAFEQLSKQYAADMNALSQQVQALSLRLDEQSSASASRLDALSSQLERQSSDAVSTDRKLRDDLNRVLGGLSDKLTELAES